MNQITKDGENKMLEDKEAKDLEIEKTLKAPIALVWSMWTEAANFQKWYGPRGADVTVHKMDLQKNSERLVNLKMQTPRGEIDMWFAGIFQEISPDSKLVYTESHSDENGKIPSSVDSAMPASFHARTVVTLELSSIGESTRMTLEHNCVPADSHGAASWKASIDKLEDLISK